MANARILDAEAINRDRPNRPDQLPPGAPDSAVMPELPLTAAEQQAIEAEQRDDDAKMHHGT